MFRKGGSTAQGSGIMSYVEPRSNFVLGGGSFQGGDARLTGTGGMFSGQTARPTPTSTPNFTLQGRPYTPTGTALTVIDQPKPSGIGMGRGLAGLGLMGATVAPVAGLAYLNRPKTVEALEYMKSMNESGVFDETAGVDSAGDDYTKYAETLKTLNETGTPLSIEQLPDSILKAIGTPEAREVLAKRKDTGKDTEIPTEDFSDYLTEIPDRKSEVKKKITPPPSEEKEGMSSVKEEVKKEAELIKDLLKDEDYSKGEMALLLAESLATPGGINKKLAKARELGAGIAATRRKEDKAVTLEAYKRFKEKEREQIKAGKPDAAERMINARVESAVKTAKNITKGPSGETLYDGLTKDQIRERTLANYFREDKFDEALSKTRLSKESEDISKNIQKINTLQGKVERGETLTKAEQDNLLKSTEYIRGLSKLPGFSTVYGPSLRKPEYISGYASGGRVKYADGSTMDDDETVDEIVTSEVAANNNETAVKPVMKLSYAELRARLPKEITDDVVNLIANNEQALQDFAYLQTQQDVGNFNVKYGVNLVLPPQT